MENNEQNFYSLLFSGCLNTRLNRGTQAKNLTSCRLLVLRFRAKDICWPKAPGGIEKEIEGYYCFWKNLDALFIFLKVDSIIVESYHS